MRKVKLWMRDFDGTVEPMAKGLNSSGVTWTMSSRKGSHTCPRCRRSWNRTRRCKRPAAKRRPAAASPAETRMAAEEPS